MFLRAIYLVCAERACLPSPEGGSRCAAIREPVGERWPVCDNRRDHCRDSVWRVLRAVWRRRRTMGARPVAHCPVLPKVNNHEMSAAPPPLFDPAAIHAERVTVHNLRNAPEAWFFVQSSTVRRNDVDRLVAVPNLMMGADTLTSLSRDADGNMFHRSWFSNHWQLVRVQLPIAVTQGGPVQTIADVAIGMFLYSRHICSLYQVTQVDSAQCILMRAFNFKMDVAGAVHVSTDVTIMASVETLRSHWYMFVRPVEHIPYVLK